MSARSEAPMKRRPTQLVATRIVRAYLADRRHAARATNLAGPEERRLRQAIECAILDDRERRDVVHGCRACTRLRAEMAK